jgi:hypothetical protein
MITNKQRTFIQKLLNDEISKEDNPKRYSEMMGRIQKQIDKAIANALWMVENCPDILKDEKREINNAELERYRRFKALAFILQKISPMTEIETVGLFEILGKLSQLYPKYYFEIIRKQIDNVRKD